MTREIEAALDRMRDYAKRSAHLLASGDCERAEMMLRLAEGERGLVRALSEPCWKGQTIRRGGGE